MLIRKMQISDLEGVAGLEKACFSQPWSIRAFEDILNTPYRVLFVAVCDDIIVGECMLTDIAGEGEITNVAVNEKYRRQGIAARLLEAVLQEGEERNLSAYTLEVRQSNLPAIRLYESYGFKTEGVRKGFYEKPVEDALIMWKHE